ncbi:spore germination protein [Gottfriedia sp. NPDC057991]|uniref:spore germination protein n=1 Tax=Gottfriedia sp. NPDC057991 TaxID=3346298 RepID=UPI0036DDD93C
MDQLQSSTLSISLHKNIKLIKDSFHQTSDLKIRPFTMNDEVLRNAAILYIDGFTDTKNLQEYILTPLLNIHHIESIEAVVTRNISIIDVTVATNCDEIKVGLSKGKALVLMDGFSEGILADSADWKMRSLTEPDTQRSSLGPLVGFNEQLTVNVNLLRNIVQTPDFTVETFTIGNKSKTNVSIMYIDEFVDQNVLEETRKKVTSINVTYLLEARVIEDALEEKKVLFPLVFTSERPDSTVFAFLKAGDVIVTHDGVKHWHGAAKDSWFEHIAITAGTPEWLESVSDEEYETLTK